MGAGHKYFMRGVFSAPDRRGGWEGRECNKRGQAKWEL